MKKDIPMTLRDTLVTITVLFIACFIVAKSSSDPTSLRLMAALGALMLAIPAIPGACLVIFGS